MSFENGARYLVGDDGVAVKQKTRTNRGYVLEGVATKYDSILYESGDRYINIQPGAFDISIRYEAPVECRLDHDEKLALTGCRVELFSNEEALNFRVHLIDSEI